jgi:hypothetical protein
VILRAPVLPPYKVSKRAERREAAGIPFDKEVAGTTSAMLVFFNPNASTDE